MQSISDRTLIEQLKSEDNASFKLLYKFYFPSIASFVKQNMGNQEDAEDIFQEAVLVLLQKVRQTDFILTSSLKTYLYAIAKNLWLKRLRNSKLICIDHVDENSGHIEPFSVELKPEKTRDEKVISWLEKITINCQRILRALFFYKEPMESLMKKMGWKNRHTAANQQYKCIQQIKKEKQKEMLF
jgi:RNA polymerase sigma factor (sigma-70 family)